MKLRARARITVRSDNKNIYDFVNRIHGEDFNCYGQYCRGGVFHADVYVSELERIKKLAEECGAEIRCYEYDSVSGRAKRYRKRFGILAGVVLVLVSAVYFSNIVMTIEIRGNENISDTAILSALGELGVETGVPLKELNLIDCENRLMVMVSGLSWAGIQQSGNRLIVNVTEMTEKPEMTRERVPCNVVAAKSAKITEVTVYDGMLMKKVGDYAMEGEMLISGVISDDTGHTTVHHAMGVIKGEYEQVFETSGNFTDVRKTETGNVKNKKWLKLFTLEIPLFFGRSKFQTSDVTESRRDFRLFGKYIPIGVLTKKETETARKEVTLSEEELKKNLMEKVYLYEKNFLSESDGVEIISRNIAETVTETGISIKVNYTLSGNICRQSDIFVK